MNLPRALDEIRPEDRGKVGGKCAALAYVKHHGFRVPPAICLCFETYLEFIGRTGLRHRIHFELNRKRFEDMRWEEIWDAALRIRNMFLKTPMPEAMRATLGKAIVQRFGDCPVAVRSSALAEDSAGMSFAGLHESYVNIKGAESILESVKLVWASLWSDRALLYRKELGLDVESSAMGVVVQKMINGEASGVAFSRSPDNENSALIEAVHGLNQGLVDGTVEPDHWEVERETAKVLSHRPAERRKVMMPGAEGLEMVSLEADKSSRPPLDQTGLAGVLDMALRAEGVFGSPQDVEWTYAGGELYTLQSRPVTTVKKEDEEDERSWYVSLTRSFDNLKTLRKKIEEEIIPGMDREARELEPVELQSLPDADLAAEIDRRINILDRWTRAYWADCIPFAHGMRLFGQFYNDAVKPADPYEFMELLSGQRTLGVERNRMLEEMAEIVGSAPELARVLREGGHPESFPRFNELIDMFVERYGAMSRAGAEEPPLPDARKKITALVLEMAGRIGHKSGVMRRNGDQLAHNYLSKFEGPREQFARELLDLGRASYRWRDDDNIYLARIEAETSRAVDLGRQRLSSRLRIAAGEADPEDVSRALRDPGYRPATRDKTEVEASVDPGLSLKPRQLTGLPAGPGIGTGPARVISGSDDLFDFKSGEILVCDAIEPEMTLVVPLAAGIVERRGGMLIHGAIVAREYGIPCVTGVPQAASLIKSGYKVTVDGYLGIVIVDAVLKQ
jgi:pyruvate,water dikinase